MYEFFAEHNPDLPPEVVPTEAVIIFLDDKGAIPISQALERMLYREELKLLSRTKFIDVVDQVIQEIEIQTQTNTTAAVEPALDIRAEPLTDPQESTDSAATEAPTLAAEPEPPTNPIHHETIAAAISTSAMRVERFQREVEATLQKRFLERLFSSDLDKMDTMVSSILEAVSWRDAAVRLDLWYAQHGVDPNGTVAMELAHALNQVYK